MIIRYAKYGDLGDIVEIYNYYVVNSHATFMERPLTLDQRQSWFKAYKDFGPHRCLVMDRACHNASLLCVNVMGWASM